MELNKIIQGDALEVLKTLPAESVDCIITSPPYWALRDYGVPGQLGLEPDFNEYINKLCDIFDEAKRVLKNEGTLWVNIGDTYSATRWSADSGQAINKGKDKDYRGIAPTKITNLEDKCLVQIPSRFAIEMTNRGWLLRNEIIWYKPNCMPSSAMDRFTIDFEKVFFFVKQKKYYFETQYEPATYTDNRKDKGLIEYENRHTKSNVKVTDERIKRTVWRISPKPFKEAHFATYPEDLIVPMIKAGSPKGGVVLDPFMGAGTTGLVAKKLDRDYLGIEINPEYIKIAEDRIKTIGPKLF